MRLVCFLVPSSLGNTHTASLSCPVWATHTLLLCPVLSGQHTHCFFVLSCLGNTHTASLSLHVWATHILLLCPVLSGQHTHCFFEPFMSGQHTHCFLPTGLIPWTCCHTDTYVADQSCYFTQSQYTDTGPSMDLTTRAACRILVSHDRGDMRRWGGIPHLLLLKWAPHHLITSPPHHLITSPPHHLITISIPSSPALEVGPSPPHHSHNLIPYL